MTNKKRSLEGKICKDCLIPLTEDNTNEYDVNAAQYVCIKCCKQRAKQKYQNRKELIREQQRVYDLAVKMKTIESYGSKCVCCGENTIEFLTIDRIHNDGIEDRKKSGGKLYRWLINHNFPKENYQILCYNCNCAKDFFGYCPHNKIEITS